MLKDFGERFVTDLRDPEFHCEFLAAYYEEEGVDGLLRALNVIAAATRDRQAPVEALEPLGPSPRRRRGRRPNPAFRTVRAALNALDLDLTIVRKG